MCARNKYNELGKKYGEANTFGGGAGKPGQKFSSGKLGKGEDLSCKLLG